MYRSNSVSIARHCCVFRRSDPHYELVDSGSQWREVQRKQAGEGVSASIQQANVISSRRSGYVNSGLETESETSYQNRNRRHRKHRSRSRSPSDGKTWLPDELKKHLEFDLIDTSGMTESQLREIPYTVVQTNHAKQLKLKHLQWGKKLVVQLKNVSRVVEMFVFCSEGDKPSHSPPPPYSPHVSESGRLRGIRMNHSSMKNEVPVQLSQLMESDLKTGSSVTSNYSSHSNQNNMLPRYWHLTIEN